MNETQLPRVERQPQRTDLTLRPHHVNVMSGWYAALYYMSKRNFSDSELVAKIKGVIPIQDAIRDEKYEPFGGFNDVIGTTVSSYEEFVAKVADHVREIPNFSSRMPVTLKATTEDPLCQACVIGSHCGAFRRDTDLVAIENYIAKDLREPLQAAARDMNDDAAIRETYEEGGILAMRLPWGVLQRYYDLNEARYYSRFPETY